MIRADAARAWAYAAKRGENKGPSSFSSLEYDAETTSKSERRVWT